MDDQKAPENSSEIQRQIKALAEKIAIMRAATLAKLEEAERKAMVKNITDITKDREVVLENYLNRH